MAGSTSTTEQWWWQPICDRLYEGFSIVDAVADLEKSAPNAPELQTVRNARSTNPTFKRLSDQAIAAFHERIHNAVAITQANALKTLQQELSTIDQIEDRPARILAMRRLIDTTGRIGELHLRSLDRIEDRGDYHEPAGIDVDSLSDEELIAAALDLPNEPPPDDD